MAKQERQTVISQAVSLPPVDNGYRPFSIPGKRGQIDFHRSPARVRALITGIGGGKTVAGANEVIRLALQIPGGHTLVIGPSYPLLKVAIRTLLGYLPQALIKDDFNKTEKELRLINDHLIEFKSSDNPDSLRGPGPDVIWVDEAAFITEEAWKVIFSRAHRTKKAFIILTTTPKGQTWLYTEVYQKSLLGDLNYDVITYRTVDNPHVDPTVVEEARKTLIPEFFRQEYEASFEAATGRVFKCWDRRIHHYDPAGVLIHKDWKKMMGLDPGIGDPCGAVFLARRHVITPTMKAKGQPAIEQFLMYREYLVPGKPVKQHAEAFRPFFLNDPLEMAACDPDSQKRDKTSGLTVLGEFANYGIFLGKGAPDVMARVNRIYNLLLPDERIGQPRLLISSSLQQITREIENYYWDPKHTNKPQDKNDHLISATGFILSYYADNPMGGTNRYEEMHDNIVIPGDVRGVSKYLAAGMNGEQARWLALHDLKMEKDGKRMQEMESSWMNLAASEEI